MRGLRVPPRWEATCFPQLKGQFSRPGPPGRVVRVHQGPAPGLHAAVLQDERELLIAREGDPVQRRRLVVAAAERPFHARAVVAPDPDHERVVELAHLFDRGEDTADVPVRVRRVAGVRLHLARVQPPLRLAQRVPRREFVVLRQLRVRRDYAELLLARERALAHDVPALVELPLVFVHPLPRDVVWRMAAAGREVHEPRRGRLLGANAMEPVDRLLGHVVREVVGLAVLAAADALHLLVLPDQRVGWPAPPTRKPQ
jgi:hypothetical protein